MIKYLTMTIGVKKSIALIAHDGKKQEMLKWCADNKEILQKHNLCGTGTTARMITDQVGLTVKGYNSGPLGGDQQIGSRIVEGEIDDLFFFTDPMTLQPHDTDVKALTRLAGVENIVFCCNRSTADHIITSPLFVDPEYERTHPDYTGYTQRFANKPVVSEAVERVNKRKGRKNK